MTTPATGRLLDQAGNWTPPFALGDDLTCRAADARWDHRLFAASQVRPGNNAFQALTLCGRRALEIPGHGAVVTCPRCLAALAED